MKTRKVMALAGAGVLAVSMMTGCGSSSSTASTTAAATTTVPMQKTEAQQQRQQKKQRQQQRKLQILQDQLQRQVLPH